MPGLLDFLNLEGGAGLLGDMRQYMGDNRNALLGLGLGLASGNNWGQGAASALQGFATGQTADQTQAGLRAAIPHILSRPDIDPAVKAAIMRNPNMATAYLTAMAKPPEYGYRDVNGVVIATNPQRPEARQVGAVPQSFNLGPGETRFNQTPSMQAPGMPSAPAAPNQGTLLQPPSANDPTMTIAPRTIAQANAPAVPIATGRSTLEQSADQAQGKVVGEARQALPQVVATAAQALDNIRAIKAMPSTAIESNTGALRPIGWLAGMIGGSDSAELQSRLNQLRGGAFLQAFNSLRGGGQITEAEGRKATDAQIRLQTAQSPAAFRQALTDYEQVLTAGITRARLQAQGQSRMDAGGSPPSGYAPPVPPPAGFVLQP